MRLSRFITDNIEEILAEWESFARRLVPAATGMSAPELRDHAKQILEAIALDIETDETPREQYKKSLGLAPITDGDESAASTHGTLRHVSGFTLLQLTAEYRAIRASVLRLWLPRIREVTQVTSNDMLRFNEAVDQALAESAVTYSERATRMRDTFLAILGHDLRSPLAAMAMSGHYLSMPGVGDVRTVEVGRRVKRSAATMAAMVHDLLEYARTQLGGKMPIALQSTSMREICQFALEDASAARPDCAFELDASGDLDGHFDSDRLQQVFSNLLNNAAQYKGKDHAVTIFARGAPDAVTVQVRNFGPVIPHESLQAIFDPLVQLSVDGPHEGRPSTSLGLGLFIAREITVAHGGSISVESDKASGTVFTVKLPRVALPQPTSSADGKVEN